MVSNSAYLTAANITDTHLEVELSDGRRVTTPLSWYPRLQNTDRNSLEHFEVCPWGLHWPKLDEDLSLEGMLLGQGATPVRSQAVEKGGFAAVPGAKIDLADIGLQNGMIDFPDLQNERRDG